MDHDKKPGEIKDDLVRSERPRRRTSQQAFHALAHRYRAGRREGGRG
ncbi:hypothetical protein [Streptomyces cinerochromogenes]